ENRILGKVALDLDRDPRFLELAGERLLATDLLRKDVARQLHRDGGEALREAHGQHVVLDGAEDTPVVDAVMAVEALVLGGDERLPDREGDLVEREHGATLETELADQAAIGGEDLRRLHLHVVAG